MSEECIICGAPLRYLAQSEQMECLLCHKTFESNTVCEAGHYVCDECHRGSLTEVMALCLQSKSRSPLVILRELMALPSCHMHGPEHHVLIGSALLTAYRNAGGAIDLPAALKEMQKRGEQVPGGVCGFWGACGAGISAGMFVSIVTGSTPLAGKEWGLSNKMTSRVLARLAEIGGPRCCKRNAYLAITEAIAFAEEHLGVSMQKDPIACIHSAQNNQCIGARCPYHGEGKA